MSQNSHIRSIFFSGSRDPPEVRIKKSLELKNINPHELKVVFSKIVSRGLSCAKFGGFDFSICTLIHSIHRKFYNSKFTAEFYTEMC